MARPPVEPNAVPITQTAHGFVPGNLIYMSGATYALASNATPAQAEVKGIVWIVNSANQFIYKTHGEIIFPSGVSGLIPGTVYFLSSSGTLTTTEPGPPAYGSVSKPVFLASSSTGGTFLNFRGMVIGSPQNLLVMGTTALRAIATLPLVVQSVLADVLHQVSGAWTDAGWFLIAGTSADNEAGGIIRPNDYDGTLNQKIWVKVSGL